MKTISSDPTHFSHFSSPNLNGSFTYNFFEDDEMEVDSIASTDLKIRYQEVKGEAKGEKRVYSREIVLRWSDFELPNGFKPSKNINYNSELEQKINSTLNVNYTYLNLQDLNIVNTIEFKVRALSDYKDAGLINNTSPITPEVLEAISKNQHNFLSYIPNSKFDQLNSKTFSIAVRNNDLTPLLDNLEYNIHSQYASTLKGLTAEALEGATAGTALKSKIQNVKKELVGFYVDKYKVIGGNFVWFKKIFVNADKKWYYDRQVTYGESYAYTVRCIFKFTLPMIESNTTKGINFYEYYLTSLPSNFTVVSCIEDIPPPPPVDLSFIWNDRFKKMNIRWRMPTNSQQDIKGFLVFKRNSVGEPFQIVKMYDFNDANPRMELPDELLRTGVVEYILENKNDKIVPKFWYDDEDFSTKYSPIYAIASYDAHGLYSNLSSQIQVSLDQINKTLKKKLISRIGAPISYPNLLIEQDLFLDSLVIDGYSNMKIYFDPDCDKIISSETLLSGQDVKEINVYETGTQDDNSKYVFSFLNVETQQFEKYELSITQPQSRIAAADY